MPRKILPRIRTVKAGKKPLTLDIVWSDDQKNIIDVSFFMNKFAMYKSLLVSPMRFSRVKLGEFGTDIVWSKPIDMSACALRHLAEEQTGKTMSSRTFKDWRRRQDYTLDSAATALGVSRRIVAYYDQGVKPIPRVVALAAKALEAGL